MSIRLFHVAMYRTCVHNIWDGEYKCLIESSNILHPAKWSFCLVSTANSSPKIFGPSHKRIDGLSLVEQNELKGAAWFQAGIPREISLEVLSRQSPGAFLVRQSSTKPGCFALSLRVPPPAPKVAHYLILRTSRGYKIKVCCVAKWTIFIPTPS